MDQENNNPGREGDDVPPPLVEVAVREFADDVILEVNNRPNAPAMRAISPSVVSIHFHEALLDIQATLDLAFAQFHTLYCKVHDFEREYRPKSPR